MAKSRKATAMPAPVTTDLYVEYATRTSQTRDRDPSDSWDRGNTASEHTLKYVQLAKEGGYTSVTYPGLVVPGEKVYVLYAVYSTGDSFGRDEDRCIEFISVHKDMDIARFNYKQVKDSVKNSYGFTIDISQDNGQTVPLVCPWLGYFERLSYVKVAGFTVRDTAPLTETGNDEDDWYEDYN